MTTSEMEPKGKETWSKDASPAPGPTASPEAPGFGAWFGLPEWVNRAGSREEAAALVGEWLRAMGCHVEGDGRRQIRLVASPLVAVTLRFRGNPGSFEARYGGRMQGWAETLFFILMIPGLLAYGITWWSMRKRREAWKTHVHGVLLSVATE